MLVTLSLDGRRISASYIVSGTLSVHNTLLKLFKDSFLRHVVGSPLQDKIFQQHPSGSIFFVSINTLVHDKTRPNATFYLHDIVLVIMKTKFKQWWSTISQTSTKRTTTFYPKQFNTNTKHGKCTTYGIRTPCHVLWQTQKCGGIKSTTTILI